MRRQKARLVKRDIVLWVSSLSYCILIFEKTNRRGKYYRKDIFWTKEYTLIFFRERFSGDREHQYSLYRRVRFNFESIFAGSRIRSETYSLIVRRCINCLITIIYGELYNSGGFYKSQSFDSNFYKFCEIVFLYRRRRIF